LLASDDEAPIFLEVAGFMGANAVRVNHLDEVKGVCEEALDSGNPVMLDAGVHGTWPASPTRSGYLDLHRYLLPRHVHTDHRSWAKKPAET
jgi:thiamine pyrophosphate-dependent acetolactate synthase large subunit-like protein